jgi:hypothetical protein
MGWTNDMIDMMRGSNGSGSGIKLAVMTGPTSCKIGNLELSATDLLISDRLLSSLCTKVSETAPSGGGTCTDKSSYLSALKAGDTVAVYQLSDEKFLVLERMVSV